MKKAIAIIIVLMVAFSQFGCFAEVSSKSLNDYIYNGSLHDYIFNMWLDDTLVWSDTFFSDHNTFTREEIEPYPEDACWIIFVPEEGMVRLCGKKKDGTWVATIWNDFVFDEMMSLCMGMCMTWDTYEKIGKLGIMFWYSDDSMNRYIVNNDQAEAFVEFCKEMYNID